MTDVNIDIHIFSRFLSENHSDIRQNCQLITLFKTFVGQN